MPSKLKKLARGVFLASLAIVVATLCLMPAAQLFEELRQASLAEAPDDSAGFEVATLPLHDPIDPHAPGEGQESALGSALFPDLPDDKDKQVRPLWAWSVPSGASSRREAALRGLPSRRIPPELKPPIA